MRFLGILLLALGLAAPVQGGIETLEVRRGEEGYGVLLVATVDRPPDQVYAVLTDYAHLARLNPAILRSRVVGRGDGGVLRVRSVIEGCVLFFCQQLVRVERVTELAGHRIRARIVPEESDFRRGVARWWVFPRPEGGSRLRLEAEVVPDFWVPPVIGPWATERSLREDLATLVERLGQGGKVPSGAPADGSGQSSGDASSRHP
jgi:hypothetical protein